MEAKAELTNVANCFSMLFTLIFASYCCLFHSELISAIEECI